MQSLPRYTADSSDSDLPPSLPTSSSYAGHHVNMHNLQNHSNPPFSGVLAPAPTLTFNPAHSHLHPHVSDATSASALSRPSQLARANSLPNNGTLNLDPVPGDPGTTFIRPPFTDFPGSESSKGGLTYPILATNAEWFLDVKDFIGPNAVGYPTQLEPPRGWCPAKKKDIKDGWKEGEEPRLRCTFCRRTYAGVNAKSMWRRHVYEKHKVPMANRRETGEKVGGRGGRSSNKENKLTSKGSETEKNAGHAGDKSIRRTVSLELTSTRASTHEPSAGPSRIHEPEVPQSPGIPSLADASILSEQALQQELYGALTDSFDDNFFQSWQHKSLLSSADDAFFFRATPPQTPGLSPSKSSGSKMAIPPESPYDPTRTPAFRHSPARLPSDQPWRASGAAMSQAVRQLTLGMLVRGEASPNVRGLDVSPIVIVPASERKMRSVFSPPSLQTPNRRVRLMDLHGDPEPDLLFPSPRRLFADEDRPDRTPSIMSRMGDIAWPSPFKDFASSGLTPSRPSAFGLDVSFPTPGGEVEDPFKAYLHLSPAPKVAGDSSPAHPPSSSGSDSPVARKRPEGSSVIPDFLGSPTPSFGHARGSLSSMSKLRWRVFPEDDEDVDMELVEDPVSLVRKADMASLGLGTPVRVQEQFRRRGDSSSSIEASSLSSSSSSAPGSSKSDKAPVSSGSTASVHSRHDSSPFRFGSHGRQRSASGSSSSHKASTTATAGLMDKILGRQEKPQRRRTGHAHEGEVTVDAMGSPFKVGRKTSRNEFLYSLDGDCEMQEAQPKKRRKTISGRD